MVAPLLTHDSAHVPALHPSVQAGDVLVADRGLCSSAHLALLMQAGRHAVRRVWARQIVDCTPGRPFGRPGFRTRQITLVTTLLAAHLYCVADLAEWARRRWQVATARAHLKTTLQMDVWHGQTVPGVLKALTIVAIVDTLVRRVMGQAAGLRHRGVERISFLDARRWLRAPRTGAP